MLSQVFHRTLSKCLQLSQSSRSVPFTAWHARLSSVKEIPEDSLPGLSLEQINKIASRDRELRSRHIQIEGEIQSDQERDSVRRRRMIYRSKQRGWLEADLLMGSWATQFVPTLSNDELDEYEIVLNLETIDAYNYISGKDVLPDHVKNLSVMKQLQRYAMTRNMASPESYEEVKKRTNLT